LAGAFGVAQPVTTNRLPQKLSLVAQTAAILKERIQAGEWHKWLPGEKELHTQLHVARMTLRGALQKLQHEGLVRSSQGKRREILPVRRPVTSQASARVLLLTPVPMHFHLPFHVLLTTALRDLLGESGYHLEIHASRAPYGRSAASSLERLIEQLRPVGCVLLTSTQNMQRWFSRRGIPCVIVGSRHPGVNLPSVDKAHRAVCRHAVGLFLARGHRRLTFLNPESGAAGDIESEQGFNEGLAQSQHGGLQANIVRHNETVPDICRKLSVLFRRGSPPTGLLIARAGFVLTAMGHLLRSGLRLPGDVALISRDDEAFLSQMVPTVARYVVTPESMACRLSSAVLEVVRAGSVGPADYLIMPAFSAGETLGPALPATTAQGK
jgi:LacI family transcriptional regulator